MSPIVELVADYPRRRWAPGEMILEQGETSSLLLILIEGEVEVLRDEIRVARSAEPGAVFGEMSVLLGGPCTATVRALQSVEMAVVEQPEAFLRGSPAASLHVAVLLARRLDALNRYLIDVKYQYEGHDHLSMVDDVLGTLMHRQPSTSNR